MKERYSLDFETTTDPQDCRVWAWGAYEIYNEGFICGNSIESFMEWLLKQDSLIGYFHNEKFDASFILNYLLRNGWVFVKDNKHLLHKQFTTLISTQGQFYSMELMYGNNRIKIYDSLKIIPFSVEVIAKSFGLPLSKLELDYSEFRGRGHQLTFKEQEYLKHDVIIVGKALKILFDQNMRQITQGSNALHDYKEVIGKKYFKKWFPIPSLDVDKDIRQAYKGGIVYVKKEFRGKDIKEGMVLDVNSLYPWALSNCPLPYGEPKYFEGQYVEDVHYNLYVQALKCSFKLRDGYMPTLQLKNNLRFKPTEYLESSQNDNGEYEQVILTLTSVDLKLLFEHYEVWDIEYLSGWKWKSSDRMFSEYVNKWMQVKTDADKNHNKGMRTLAKLMLNALYGKFGLNPYIKSKYPYLQDGVLKFETGPLETRDPIYIGVAVFVTAWARHKLVTSVQKVWDRFVYCDTDSLHITGWEIPKDIEIDSYRLGAFKIENRFIRARFLRQKCYLEDIICYDENMERPGHKLSVTCAGLPHKLHNLVTWNNFKVGATYYGKLQAKQVENGVVLNEIEFTIKG